ncbi:D-2-hydroxyglutarate dehydrogenase YdiJ [Teredinibacter waterburyi]|uniref:D-2-hydroxyglutarate dehydrogenase YdiJ n=1 Tax=Teredinibacter waterburyi TaxID=1500538 RepID=UPI00165F1D27|nr:FAD-binding and (Fe-S)-binding domain-containing protein [Teredinibacter waterburyi]
MIPKLKLLADQAQTYLDFLSDLEQRGFNGDIHADQSSRIALATDNSIYQVMPEAVVCPRNRDDLVTLTQLAAEAQYQAIVLTPRGGGTGTNGQSLTDGIVVDLSRHMNNIIEVNAEQGWVIVETGVVKDQLNAALKPHGLFFAPDLSTSNRATIGGMINTDASGQGSCLYGKTRDHVLELETVLIDGSIIDTHAISDEQLGAITQGDDRCSRIYQLVDSIQREHQPLIDEIFPPLNRCLTGYDLAHIRDQQNCINLNNILCGSEGTLGFISRAKLNVLPIPKYSALVLVKYADFNSSLRDATELMKSGPASIETVDSKVLNLAMEDFIWQQVEEFFEGDDTKDIKGINLVEFTGNDEAELNNQIEQLTSLLASSVAHQGNTPDFETDTFTPSGRIGYSVAWGDSAVKSIWAMRKRAVGLLGNARGEARPIPFVEDTAVPPENLADFILEFREILDGYRLDYGMFGHVDAGVLHVRPALDMKDPEQEDMAWEISDRVADLCHEYGGLLWGEHGKGVRSSYSPQFFGELYPQLQRIKAAFDPHNQLNPGKIATPDDGEQLLKIDEVPTRGQQDREIKVETWQAFPEAVYCNGNGACYNYNPNEAMCPSWKGTRDRIHSPKGRASLFRTWLKLLSDHNVHAEQELQKTSAFKRLFNWPRRVVNSLTQNREADFSHQVYDAMATCLACKACASQCPIKVDVPEFRSKFISLYHTRYTRPLKDYLVGSLEYLLPWCAKVPLVYNLVMDASPVKWILRKGVGFVDGPLLSRGGLNKQMAPVASVKMLNKLSEADKQRTVIIVQDAFTRYFETPLIDDIFTLLRELGFNPLLAPFKANGKPLHVHGFLSSFTRAARNNAKMLNRFSDAGVALIGVDPSMTYTYRAEYKKVLESEEGLYRAPQVKLMQEWLAEQTDALQQLQQRNVEKGKKYTLMPHCIEQTHAARERDLWRTIFVASGFELDILSLGCCGMSGTYGHEARNLETSKKIYQLSWAKPVANIHASQLVATGYSCRSQIKREDGKVVKHPLQVLLMAINESDQSE